MKRAKVAFDIEHFEKKRKSGSLLTIEDTFQEIFNTNHWAGDESFSGPGSDSDQTQEIRKQIPLLIKKLGIRKFLDIPCGDFNWFSKMELNLESYTGGDIVSDIVYRNQSLFAGKNRRFIKIDLMHDPLPEADILLCRDCLVHFSNVDIQKSIENLKRSKIRYVLTTTFVKCNKNTDIVTGDWRIINLQKPPFSLPAPMLLINENCAEGDGTYADKCLGLWAVEDL